GCLAPGEDLRSWGKLVERAGLPDDARQLRLVRKVLDGRRCPQMVPLASEDAQPRSVPRDGLEDSARPRRSCARTAKEGAGELVLTKEVGEDAPHRSLCSSLSMNSAFNPAASRPSRRNVRPRAFFGVSGQVRLARKASQADSSCRLNTWSQVQPK